MSAYEALREKFNFTVDVEKDAEGGERILIVYWKKVIVPATNDKPSHPKWQWKAQTVGWRHDVVMWNELLRIEEEKRGENQPAAHTDDKPKEEVSG